MSSQARRNASQANGRKSSGPKTPARKAVSSQNALRHSLVSSTILIDGESSERFEDLLALQVAELEPQSPTELMLVENMAACKWKQLRIWAFENIGISEEIRRQVDALPEIAAKGMPERGYYALRELVETHRIMDETRFDRQYLRAFKMLREIRSKK